MFEDVYNVLKESAPAPAPTVPEMPLVNLKFRSIRLASLCRFLADHYGIAVVLERGLDDQVVTVEGTKVRLDELLRLVGRRCGVEVTWTGSVFYLGASRPEDKGVLMRRVRGVDKEVLRAGVESVLGDGGKVEVLGSGVVLVTDSVERLRRVEDVLVELDGLARDTWIVQLYVLRLTDQAELRVGLDVVPAAQLSWHMAVASGGQAWLAMPQLLARGEELNAALDAVLDLARNSSLAWVVAEPLLLLSDGDGVKVVSGQRIPVRKRTVSDQGTVSTTGFDEVVTGLELTIRLSELARGRAALGLSLALSEVTDYVEEVPLRTEDSLETRCVVESGGVYLLAQMSVTGAAHGWAGRLGTVRAQDRRYSRLSVWGRVYRISGGARGRHGVEVVESEKGGIHPGAAGRAGAGGAGEHPALGGGQCR